jgi:hypothetical protein
VLWRPGCFLTIMEQKVGWLSHALLADEQGDRPEPNSLPHDRQLRKARPLGGAPPLRGEPALRDLRPEPCPSPSSPARLAEGVEPEGQRRVALCAIHHQNHTVGNAAVAADRKLDPPLGNSGRRAGNWNSRLKPGTTYHPTTVRVEQSELFMRQPSQEPSRQQVPNP